jgi:hypothetical protein
MWMTILDEIVLGYGGDCDADVVSFLWHVGACPLERGEVVEGVRVLVEARDGVV